MSAGRWRPTTPEGVAVELAEWLAGNERTVRVAVDGPPCAQPEALAQAIAESLRTRGRRPVHIRAHLFWRAASLRLEHGREDVDSYLRWLDADALDREVLRPVVERGEYLPSLRDPETDRSTHARPVPAGPDTVLLVSGQFLLGQGLSFDRIICLSMSATARARRTPDDQAWTLAAFSRYDAETDPGSRADVTIRVEDPARPAVRGLP